VPTTPQRGAKTELERAPGVELQGGAEFSSEVDGVRAYVRIEKATPGKHGIHVHEKPDCSDIPNKSMGAHFAPDTKEHGLPQSPKRHLGDLGNIEVGPDGRGQLEIKVLTATLDDGPRSFADKALVIHEKEDVGTGPSGESGPPIACGVIKVQHLGAGDLGQ
jgi:Cu-Zn family superoxide dismutase